MTKHLNKLMRALFSTEQGHQSLTKYAQMTEHPGWAVHKDCLVTLKGLILEELLGRQFTKLDATEKDVQQRAYAGVNEVIDFLLNPVAEARSMNKVRKHNMKMGATVTGATKGEQK